MWFIVRRTKDNKISIGRTILMILLSPIIYPVILWDSYKWKRGLPNDLENSEIEINSDGLWRFKKTGLTKENGCLFKYDDSLFIG